jgi:hypothetical protein
MYSNDTSQKQALGVGALYTCSTVVDDAGGCACHRGLVKAVRKKRFLRPGKPGRPPN